MKNVFQHGEPEDVCTVNAPRSFIVMPQLPPALSRLVDIAYNLWWVWNSDAFELFRRMDHDTWDAVNHNPIIFLGVLSTERLEELAHDPSFVAHLEDVHAQLTRYLGAQSWFQREFAASHPGCRIAYFSMEYGLAESLPIYSGGLGVLAGDHCKSASDMGVPLTAVGLAYRYGYFVQRLTDDGWQQERYEENHFFRMPMRRVKDADGRPLKLSVELPAAPHRGKQDAVDQVWFETWQVQVGRNELYLMSTDVPENPPEYRGITANLYGGDQENRLRQEILLGIGGARLLAALGIVPTVWHMNEGHSAFVNLERIRMLVHEQKLPFAVARECVSASSIFTTHTPVPAGIDVFPPELMTRYFSGYCASVGISMEQLLALGRENPADTTSGFSMAVLALRCSYCANGVSRLHGVISRKMWHGLFPGLPLAEVPIGHVTNGIHSNTWISSEMSSLFDRYIGPAWKDEPENQSIWQRIAAIPDGELWRSHERRRERLVSFARQHLRRRLESRGATVAEIRRADEVLDPEALTIGFARRFAEYKRGALLFRNLERIKRILSNRERPVQIIIAGKAHPHDSVGKELIKYVTQLLRDPDLRDRVVFLEDYNMNIAHYLVQGCDVWLNLPRRPLEASGTSGMKAAVNGVLNVSVLDGWWCEAYDGTNGWAVGAGEEFADHNLQDEVESRIVYDLLEQEVVPLFYTRGADGIPREWVRKMKQSMITICPRFNTNRLIEEYTVDFYLKAHERNREFSADNYALAREFTAWLERVQAAWGGVHVVATRDTIREALSRNESFEVEATITMNGLSPEDLAVQLYWGYLDSQSRITNPAVLEMACVDAGAGRYTCTVHPDKVGHCGYVVRILPKHGGTVVYRPNLIRWQ